VGVHGDDSADFAFEGLLGGHLEVEIDGELEVFAGGSEFLTEVAQLFAVTVDDDVAATVDSTEEGVVGGFDAGAADDIAGRVEGVAVVVGEHLLGDFADVADEVSGESVAGVEAALLVEGLEFRKLVAMGGDEGLFVGGDVLFEGNRLILGGDLEAAQRGLDLLDWDVEAAGDERQVGVEVLDLFTEEIAGDGGVVVDEESAFAVEEFAARGEDGDLADTVRFSKGTEVFRVEHLEAPEASEQDDENQRDQILDGVELADGQLLGLAGALSFRMMDWFHA
jgi:hypothetical protein